MFNTYEVLTLLFLFGGFIFELLEYIQKKGK
ncbi:putative holin-like toxin [Roseburia sp. 499]|nr:putative holin-like toxin [Roseburia sp. 499]WVK68688.1 putative holin-like toxin [Roseburia sp. 499]